MSRLELPSDRKNLFGRDLTPREIGILLGIARGETNTEIGKSLGISVNNMGAKRSRIFLKLGAKNAPQAVVLAFQRGLFRTPLSFYTSEELLEELDSRQ